MPRASAGLGGAGSLQVTDSGNESVTKRATRRFPSEPCDVPAAVPVPLTASIPKAEGAKELRCWAGPTTAGDASWRWGEPSGAGAAAGAAAARGQRSPGPATPEPPGAADAPASASAFRGSSVESTVTSPRWAGRGLLMEPELVAGRIISPSSTSIALRLCGFSPATRPYRCAGRHLGSPWRCLVPPGYSFLFHSALRTLSVRALVPAIL